MSKNKYTLNVLVLLCVCSGVLILFYLTQDTEKKSQVKRDEKKNLLKKNIYDDQKRKKINQTNSRGDSRVPFEKYKKVYEESDDILSKIPFDKDSCKNKQGNVKYSWIEFIFLERTDTGELRPFPVNGIDIDYIENESCHSASGVPLPASARFLYPVIKNCECVINRFKPNTMYKLREIGNYGKVNYTLKIPAAEKFNFVSAENKKEVTPADSNKEPDPYKYPIVVNNIEKRSMQEKTEKVTYETIKFKNVMNHVRTKIGQISNVEVKYILNGESYKTDEKLNDGTYKIKIQDPGEIRITGGAVAVYGQVTKVLKSSKHKSVNGEPSHLLLMYKPEVTSTNVNMAKGLSYNYSRAKTIMKEINLKKFVDDETMKKFREKNKFMAAVLQKKFKGRKKRTIVNWVSGYRKQGEFYARLEAPPGDYLLSVAVDSNKQRIKWPMENRKDEEMKKRED